MQSISFNVLRLPDVDGAPECKGGFIWVAPLGGPSMCPERLPEERKSKRPACATRASLARRAEHARSYGTAASAAGKSC